ncbi:hypothetical protein TSAR_010583 [Trichomalopsis sarcophagae]|uniref:Uncharacterized protein n=1 Tax=Trichomalopsis sarcophagae TaxID=543379 RepID=A0A232EDR2_9HYME|nr:hypothetical protein TSAR_010583 [Trichomalopsis sarcophagae]
MYGLPRKRYAPVCDWQYVRAVKKAKRENLPFPIPPRVGYRKYVRVCDWQYFQDWQSTRSWRRCDRHIKYGYLEGEYGLEEDTWGLCLLFYYELHDWQYVRAVKKAKRENLPFPIPPRVVPRLAIYPLLEALRPSYQRRLPGSSKIGNLPAPGGVATVISNTVTWKVNMVLRKTPGDFAFYFITNYISKISNLPASGGVATVVSTTVTWKVNMVLRKTPGDFAFYFITNYVFIQILLIESILRCLTQVM